MKNSKNILIVFALLSICFNANSINIIDNDLLKKDPIVIEIETDFENIKEALMETKNVLLKQKFIALDGIKETSFVATRTTNSKSDYYIADVVASKNNDKVVLTITLVKVGTGLLKLKKVAVRIKEALE